VTADFTATPRVGAADLTVGLSGLATPVPPYRLVESKFRDLDRYDLSIVSWSWNFGDGQTGTGQNVNHVYTEPGVYSVTLSLLVSDGTTARCQKMGHVIVTSDNLPPEAQDLQVVAPDQPRAGDGLSIDYVYYDPDDDPQDDAEIRWYKNTEAVPEFDDQPEIPSGAAKHGETWYYLVRVSDGEDWSEWVQSPDITILNSPPEAQEPVVIPGSPAKATTQGVPQTADYLQAAYDYYDIDSEDQAGEEIRWYLDGEQQAELDDQNSVSPDLTVKGQSWYFMVRVSDGTDWSEWVSSPAVIIANTPPTATPEIWVNGQPPDIPSYPFNKGATTSQGLSVGFQLPTGKGE